MLAWLGEEFGEVAGGQVGGFFGDEVPGRDESAAQVGGDYGEPFGELRRYPVPRQMRFGHAVQQQDRRPLPAPAAVDRRTRRRDIEFLEPVEHEPSLSLPARRALRLVRYG